MIGSAGRWLGSSHDLEGGEGCSYTEYNQLFQGSSCFREHPRVLYEHPRVLYEHPRVLYEHPRALPPVLHMVLQAVLNVCSNT